MEKFLTWLYLGKIFRIDNIAEVLFFQKVTLKFHLKGTEENDV